MCSSDLGGVNYHEASSGALNLALSPELAEAFEEDYQRMDEMIYGDKPDFNDLLGTLNEIEGYVNKALRD